MNAAAEPPTVPSDRRPSGPSLRAIVGGGAAFVAVCLGLALTFAVASLARLGAQSERVMTSGVDSTRLIEQLADNLTEVERTARQHAVVRSPDLLQIYGDRRTALLETLGALENRDDLAALEPVLSELRDLLARSTVSPGAVPEAGPDGADFASMKELAARARDIAQQRFEVDLAGLQRRVDQVQAALTALTIAVVAAALLVAFAFARLISRPMRQITAAITRLGRADLDPLVHVDGPRDLQDIGTSLDWLRRRIRDLEAQKSTFVRHMSHELKSPLANIQAGIDLLKEVPHGDSDSGEIIAIVERNATRLKRQIDDLLTYAGWQDAQPPQQPAPVRLDRLIERCLDEQILDAGARRVTVKADGLEPLTITGDESQLRAIVDNLVSNAIKYSPAGGTVELHLRRHGDRAYIEVQDRGPGIPIELRERVFEAFFRGPDAGATAGTGIGLSLALAAARAHGGTIRILDEADGAHVRVVLPLAPDRQPKAVRDSSADIRSVREPAPESD